jgi:putative MATE family efflux protein
MSVGAMGGGVSSAMARALGSGNRPRAEAIAVHALIIAVVMACLFTLLFAFLARPLFALLGGRGEALDGATLYARIIFGGAVVVWLANTLASLLRGTGNMAVPSLVFTLAAGLHIALSAMLTLGLAGAPKLGIAGPAAALIGSQLFATLVMFAYLATGRSDIRLRLTGITLERGIFKDILRVGAVACLNAALTIATILIVTGLIGRYGTAALAGYGLGSRLELLLIPITFSVGAAMTAMVGANRGAGQHVRARQTAWTGSLAVAAVTGLIGLVVAVAPDLWIGLFTTSDEAARVARQYFAVAGPCYVFFGLGQALYFATQGTGSMVQALYAGVARMVVAAGGGAALAIIAGAPLIAVFAAVALGFAVFGGILALSLLRGTNWNPDAASRTV